MQPTGITYWLLTITGIEPSGLIKSRDIPIGQGSKVVLTSTDHIGGGVTVLWHGRTPNTGDD